MTQLPFENQQYPSLLSLYGFAASTENYLTLNGTLNRLGVFQDSPVLPGLPGDPGPNGQPPWLTGPGSPNDPGYQGTFDYLKLGRLPTQPNLGLVQVARKTLFTVNTQGQTLDISNMFLSGSWLRPITGLSEGEAEFILTAAQQPLGIGTVTNSLSVIRNIQVGDTFSWSHVWPTGSSLVGFGYILKEPKIYLNNDGQTQFVLQLGCQLSLFSNSSRLKQTLYCGRDPLTAQEAAQIYAQTNGLFTRTYAPGHNLADRSKQTFTSESPHQYLQALYAPTNQDIRCSNTSSAIICVPRPSFNSSAAHQLNHQNALELDPVIQDSFEPFNSLRVYNNFQVLSSVQQQTQVFKSISGQPENTKPWFQGGYTETISTEITRGDTLVWSSEVTLGYIPVLNQGDTISPTTNPLQAAGDPIIISKADYSADPCDGQPLETTWGIIETQTYSVSTQEHASGAQLITAYQTWVNGLKPRQITSETIGDFSGNSNSSGDPAAVDDWVIYNGRLEYSKESFGHTPQINRNVCPKDFIHLETTRRLDRYTLGSDFVFRRTLTEADYYQAFGVSGDVGQSAYIGSGQTWAKTENRGAYDNQAESFIVQPPRTFQSSPPNSKWVRPALQDVEAFRTITNPLISQNGRLFNDRPKPETAPFCYTQNQLETYGQRLLQQNNGLSQAKEIVLPFFQSIALGDSVIYTDQNEESNTYLVFSIGIAQEGPNVTKAVTLAQYT